MTSDSNILDIVKKYLSSWIWKNVEKISQKFRVWTTGVDNKVENAILWTRGWKQNPVLKDVIKTS